MNRVKLLLAYLVLLVALGCRQGTADPVGKPSSGQGKDSSGSATAFLDQKKEIPPRLEWNKEIVAKKPGTIRFRIDSQGPFAVTLVTAKGYDAVKNKKSVSKSDVLLTVDSKGPSFEKSIGVPAGSSWFIIENQADKKVEFRLQCFAE